MLCGKHFLGGNGTCCCYATSVSSSAGEWDKEASTTPGSKVSEWKIRVDEAKGWVKIGRNKSSISKLRQHYGKPLCWPMAVCRFKGNKAAACCPNWGEPGHTHGSSLHTIDAKKHEEVNNNFAKFRWKGSEDGDKGNGQQ